MSLDYVFLNSPVDYQSHHFAGVWLQYLRGTWSSCTFCLFFFCDLQDHYTYALQTNSSTYNCNDCQLSVHRSMLANCLTA